MRQKETVIQKEQEKLDIERQKQRVTKRESVYQREKQKDTVSDSLSFACPLNLVQYGRDTDFERQYRDKPRGKSKYIQRKRDKVREKDRGRESGGEGGK